MENRVAHLRRSAHMENIIGKLTTTMKAAQMNGGKSPRAEAT